MADRPAIPASSNVDTRTCCRQAVADGRRARHQRRSVIDAAGRECVDQGNKNFDLLIYPVRITTPAAAGEYRLRRRKRFDFFVRHLLNQNRPMERAGRHDPTGSPQ
jgi:hypothetical protein